MLKRVSGDSGQRNELPFFCVCNKNAIRQALFKACCIVGVTPGYFVVIAICTALKGATSSFLQYNDRCTRRLGIENRAACYLGEIFKGLVYLGISISATR